MFKFPVRQRRRDHGKAADEAGHTAQRRRTDQEPRRAGLIFDLSWDTVV